MRLQAVKGDNTERGQLTVSPCDTLFHALSPFAPVEDLHLCLCVCICMFCVCVSVFVCFVCLCLCVTQCFPVFRCPTACGIAVRQWKPYTERNSVYYVHIVHSLSAPLNICIRPMMMLRDMFVTIFVAQRENLSSPPVYDLDADLAVSG